MSPHGGPPRFRNSGNVENGWHFQWKLWGSPISRQIKQAQTFLVSLQLRVSAKSIVP